MYEFSYHPWYVTGRAPERSAIANDIEKGGHQKSGNAKKLIRFSSYPSHQGPLQQEIVVD